MDGNNPGHAKRVQLIERTLAAGATLESDVFALYHYDRIGGTLHCDQAATLTAYQGPTSTHPQYLDYAESLAHPGDANVGAASKLNFEIFSAEGYGQVKVTNNGSAAATIRLAIELRRKA